MFCANPAIKVSSVNVVVVAVGGLGGWGGGWVECAVKCGIELFYVTRGDFSIGAEIHTCDVYVWDEFPCTECPSCCLVCVLAVVYFLCYIEGFFLDR